MFRKVPLIIILGSTGTGKTKLSIELAQKFGGEIISADSMQLYRNLDIVTAKATKEEQAMVKHHLLDIANPGKAFTVVDFRDAAVPIIDQLLNRSQCPIVVGGTNYYIESLLWKVLVNPPQNVSETGKRKSLANDDDLHGTEPKRQCPSPSPTIKSLTYAELEEFDSNRLHELLLSVDSASANRLHPNNRRKVLRALEVYLNTGQLLSDILHEQQNTAGGSTLGGPLRYEHVILFWLRCNQDVLNERLDKRIDGMLAQGLLPEIRAFYESMGDVQDCTKGILQTIGFKEFLPYMKMYDKHHDHLVENYIKQTAINDDNAREDIQRPDGMDLLDKCLAELCLVTKRYSRKQIKWVTHRFLGSVNRDVPPIYGLDTTNPANWLTDVYLPAENVVQSYMDNVEPNLLKPLETRENPRAHLNENVTNFCEICERRFIGEYQWDIHMKSGRHKKRLFKKTKKQFVADSVVGQSESDAGKVEEKSRVV